MVSAVASSASSSSATITWTTSNAGNSQVSYGTSTGVYTTTTSLADTSPTVTSHSVLLPSLVASTTYYYIVTSNGVSSAEFSFTTPAASSGSGGGGSSGGSGSSGPIYYPPPTPTPTPAPTPGSQPGSSPAPAGPASILPAPASVGLINDAGTFYVVSGGVRFGVTDPGILNSYGFTFSDATNATPADLANPIAANLPPNSGALVRTASDPTVYLVSDGSRYAFTSASVFTALGYKFSNVLVVTTPELGDDAEGLQHCHVDSGPPAWRRCCIKGHGLLDQPRR